MALNKKSQNMKALFLPYGYAIYYKEIYFWQLNLGKYMDRLSSIFKTVTIVCKVEKEHGKYLFTSEGKPIYPYSMENDDIRVSHFPQKLFSKIRSLISEANNTDFVYIFLPSFKGIFAALVCKLLHKPFAIYMGSDWNDVAPFLLPEIPGFLNPIAKSIVGYLEKKAVMSASFTLARGESIVRRYHGEKNNVFSAAASFNWDTTCFYSRTDTCAKKEIKALFTGTICERKGIMHLIKAIAIAKDKSISISLSIVGRGKPEYENFMRSMILNFNLQDNIEIIGYVSEPDRLIDIYRESDLFILPTLGEGFPRVIYEAMSQSLPVITTTTGSIPDVLSDGVTALLVPPGSPENLADAIIKLSKKPAIRRRLITNGIRLATEEMKKDALIQFEELFYRFISPAPWESPSNIITEDWR